jgi:type IV pilus assembly protein PilC
MSAELPLPTQILIAVGTTARDYVIFGGALLVAAGVAFRLWLRTETGREAMERTLLKAPFIGDIWIKYQVAQFSRVLSTLLIGGIPLLPALETASESLGAVVLRKTLARASKLVKEGQPLSNSLRQTKVFPGLSLDMMEVGESTGALPAMLSSVAEFYEEDVNTNVAAALTLVEPAIMIFMGIFVAFVLVSLYLPIFSLADSMK